MPSYSDERREAVVAKLLPPRNLPVREVAQQEGISAATVYKWRKEAREQGRCLPNAGDGGTAAWSSKDKFAAVLETAAMNGADAGRVLPSPWRVSRADRRLAPGL